MENLFLILHKVRGEPAFDIAEQLQIGEELGWIIPTSGHRAYPYASFPLCHLMWSPTEDDPKIPITDATESLVTNLGGNDPWPDHYTTSREPSTPTKTLGSLLSIVKKVPKLKIRRIT